MAAPREEKVVLQLISRPGISHVPHVPLSSLRLALERYDLTELPPEVGRLINLKELCLSNNQLTTLPPEIGRLINLTKLWLNCNQLAALPPEIGLLINLSRLNLGRNQLTTLPLELFRLINLTELWVYGNQLTTLPPEIGRLINLTKLDLSFNKLTTLPPEIFHLINLKELFLSHNKLTTLPPEIGRLTMTTLSLSENKLTTLPPEIGRLTNLTELYLFGNPFNGTFLRDLSTRRENVAHEVLVPYKLICSFSAPTNTSPQFLRAIALQGVINIGNFGTVFRGEWNDVTPVALKSLIGSSEEEFMAEVSTLQNLHHPNVLQFFGVTELLDGSGRAPSRFMVMELAEGNVLELVRTQQELSLHPETLVKMALSCAAGMAYLGSKRIVHRDLAARNLLFFYQGASKENIIIKVADFGLARTLDSSGLFVSPDQFCPLKWTAPEGLRNGKFSVKSDVWSFGVVLWELFNKGAVPYGHERLTHDEMLAKLDAGERLKRQPGFDSDSRLVDIMKSCWTADPAQRPTFEALIDSLRTFCTSQVRSLASATDASTPSRSDQPSSYHKVL